MNLVINRSLYIYENDWNLHSRITWNYPITTKIKLCNQKNQIPWFYGIYYGYKIHININGRSKNIHFSIENSIFSNIVM